jgi:hypothetical protein
MVDFKDLVEHPHDRGELTYIELLQLLRDWEESGHPFTWEGMLDFGASSPTWGDLPLHVITRTLRSAIEGRPR